MFLLSGTSDIFRTRHRFRRYLYKRFQSEENRGVARAQEQEGSSVIFRLYVIYCEIHKRLR